MRRQEDAEFWTRVTSLGFRAKKVTQAVTMEHRIREDSKGMTEWREEGREPDWTAWFPWRFGAASNNEGRKLLKEIGRRVPNPQIVPFGAQGEPPEKMKSWPVHDYSYPYVTIVVTVGPGHEKYLRDALDSVAAQTYPDWECFVVNDTGKEWKPNSYWDSPLAGYPWANYVSTMGNFGTSRARNAGAKFARGETIIWLDADDYWVSWLLERMVAMVEENNGIIYSDIFQKKPGQDIVPLKTLEFDCDQLIKRGMYPGTSVLVPKWIHTEIIKKQQGWDENIPGQEDWDYQIAASVYANACAYKIDEPLFIYRVLPEGNREKHKDVQDDIIKYINDKWSEYRTGAKKIMCGCSGKRRKLVPKSKLSSTGVNLGEGSQQFTEKTVLLEYHGDAAAPISIRGPITKTTYRFCRQPSHSKKFVWVEDAREMLGQLGRDGNPIFSIVDNQPTLTPDVKAFLQT
jgi:hypothetical protein